jgi:hypothetical protein
MTWCCVWLLVCVIVGFIVLASCGQQRLQHGVFVAVESNSVLL